MATEGQQDANSLAVPQACSSTILVLILSDLVNLTSAHINTSTTSSASLTHNANMAHAGTAHKYSEKLIAFEHAGAHSKNGDQAPNTLLWIGGLGDGLLTVQ